MARRTSDMTTTQRTLTESFSAQSSTSDAENLVDRHGTLHPREYLSWSAEKVKRFKELVDAGEIELIPSLWFDGPYGIDRGLALIVDFYDHGMVTAAGNVSSQSQYVSLETSISTTEPRESFLRSARDELNVELTGDWEAGVLRGRELTVRYTSEHWSEDRFVNKLEERIESTYGFEALSLEDLPRVTSELISDEVRDKYGFPPGWERFEVDAVFALVGVGMFITSLPLLMR